MSNIINTNHQTKRPWQNEEYYSCPETTSRLLSMTQEINMFRVEQSGYFGQTHQWTIV